MKILFSDLDGTVLFNSVPKEEDVAAIRKFQEDGNLFVFCTGRGVGAIADAQKQLNPDYLCLNSGAHILDKEHNDLFKKIIDKEVCRELLKDLGDDCYVSIIYTDKGVHLLGDFPFYGAEFPVAESIDEVNGNIVGVGALFKEKSQAYECTKKLNSIKGDKYDVYQNEASLDVVGKDCSKGTSILTLIDILKIDMNDVYCIGDSYNDLTMFECCPNSFSFNTSDQPIKDSVKYLVDSVAEAIKIIEEA